MRRSDEVEIERFEAIAEDGRRFTIISAPTTIDVSTRDDLGAKIPGLNRWITTEGAIVTHTEDDLYYIIDLDLVVRRTQSAR